MGDDSLQNAYESAYDGMLSALEENRELTLEIESLRQQLKKASLDAARYQYLRCIGGKEFVKTVGSKYFHARYDEYDNRVDALIGKPT